MNRVLSGLRAAKSMATLVRDPSRLDQVFVLSDAVAQPNVLYSLQAALEADPRTLGPLRRRRRLGPIDFAALGALPEDTLGRAYAEHMATNAIVPESIPTMTSDQPLEFVRAHLYETHDIWHTVTGFSTDVAGELGLQAFYLAQMPNALSSALLATGLVHTVVVSMEGRDRLMRAVVRGWLLGKRAKPLFGVAWDDWWDRSLADVRRDLDIDVATIEASLPRAA